MRCGVSHLSGLTKYSPARKLISKVMTLASGICTSSPRALFLSLNSLTMCFIYRLLSFSGFGFALALGLVGFFAFGFGSFPGFVLSLFWYEISFFKLFLILNNLTSIAHRPPRRACNVSLNWRTRLLNRFGME